MTGDEFKAARFAIGNAVGDRLSFLDMAALCGLADPAGNGKDTIRKWEDGDGPSGPVATLLTFLVECLRDEAPEVFRFAEAFVRRQVGITD